jgi:UDP-N-acetylmuramyl tripeptide synthase
VRPEGALSLRKNSREGDEGIKREISKLRPNSTVVVIKEQRERLQKLIEKKRFKDESEAVRNALALLLAPT